MGSWLESLEREKDIVECQGLFAILCVVGCWWVLVDVVASVLCEDVVGCLVDVSMDVWMSGGGSLTP